VRHEIGKQQESNEKETTKIRIHCTRTFITVFISQHDFALSCHRDKHEIARFKFPDEKETECNWNLMAVFIMQVEINTGNSLKSLTSFIKSEKF
jgi:hypothetical protein